MRAVPVALAAVAVLAVPAPASASCVGPEIEVTPATAAVGEILTVRGEYFGTDCHDTGPPPEGQGVLGEPAEDIEVVLRHGDGEVVLARGAAEADYSFTVEVSVPDVLAGGTSIEARYDATAVDRVVADADLTVRAGEGTGTPAVATFGPEPTATADDSADGEAGVGPVGWVGLAVVLLVVALWLWWRGTARS